MDSQDSTLETPHAKTIQRLDRAWKAIVTEHLLEKSKGDALKEGEGMSVFHFLRPSKGGDPPSHNCDYYYVEKDSAPWTMIINAYPKKEALLRTYKRSEMYIICVSVPEYDVGDSSVQEIRVFRLLDNSEVEF